MKFEYLKKKSPKDLQTLLQESRQKLSQLRFDLPAGKVKNVREIRSLRKDIAQIFTLLNIK